MGQYNIQFVANTTQSDAKIKQMSRYLQDLTAKVRQTGATFEFAEEEDVNFIKSLSTLGSMATNAKLRVTDMSRAIQELQIFYNRMTDEEKASPIGKASISSINMMKSTLASYKTELASVIELEKKRKAYVSPTTGWDWNTTKKKAYVAPTTTINPAGSITESVEEISSASGSSKGLFGSILGGNLAARAVMETLRFFKNTIKDAVKVNMEFEQSNAELSAVLGRTKGEISDLTDQARYLGATTLYTANEITNLQIALGRLGFNKSEIKASTEAVSQLALATGVDLKDAATLTGSTLRAFGYRASEAARVASVLGVSTTKSALDMEKLKTAMSYAASVARQAGFDIEDVVAMLGKMVDNGQQATTAGVNLRNIFLDLSNKSSKLSQAIKKVTGKDQIRSFDEFVEALRKMREEGINLDDVANVVQKRVTPGFLNMIANTEGIAQLRDELKGCNGELKDMADKMTNTLQGSVTLLTSAWDGLMLSFGNSNGVIKSVVDDLTDLVNKLREAREESNKAKNKPGVIAYEKPDNAKVANETYVDLYAQGKTNKQIMAQAKTDQANYQAQADIYKELKGKYDDFFNRSDWGEDAAWKLANEIGNATGQNINKIFNELLDRNKRNDVLGWINNQLQGYSDKAIQQGLLYELAKSGKGISLATGDISGATGLGLGKKDETKSALSGYEERIAKAYDSYAVSLNNAAIEVENGSMTEKEYLEKKLSATQQLYRAYVMVIAEIERELEKNPALKGELTPLLDQLKPQLAGYVNEMSELSTATGILAEEQKKAAEKLKAANATKAMDLKILRGLEGVANRAKTGWTPMGLNGIAERINLGVDIPDSEWQKLVDEQINPVLKGLNLDKIRIEFETGNIEKVKQDLEIFKTQLSSMQSVVSGLGSIKSAITDMMSAFEECTEPFDAFLTVFSRGFQMIESGIAIYEAFTKLQEISQLLTKAHTAAKIEDTVATNANTLAGGENATEKLTEADAALVSAEAHTADAAAKVAGSVAWVPWVGGALAAVAVAALIAKLVQAREDSKKVGYMATGGIVEGNGMRPKGTDTVPTMLTPGEVVLNAAMSSNVASKLQGAGGQMVMVQGESRITGEEIKIVYNNYAKRRGLKTQLA